MFNYNLPKPQVLEIDTTVRNFEELRNINGQNYVTITAAVTNFFIINISFMILHEPPKIIIYSLYINVYRRS